MIKSKSKYKMRKFYYVFIIFCSFILLNCNRTSQSRVIAKVNDDIITEAEFVNTLPSGFTSDSIEKAYRHSLLNQLITKKLFIQQAKKIGLDKEIEYTFERDKKTILIQELYSDVVTKNVKISPKELEEAKKLMAMEVHLKIIVVPDQNTADMVSNELKKGLSFDTLVKLYSEHASRRDGGDLGFVPLLHFEEPVRNVIQKMNIGTISEPIPSTEDFKIVNYLEKRQSSEPDSTLKADARMILEQEKSQKLASDYLKKIYARLEYNPEGLKLFYKPVDSITPEEGDIWVVKKDNKKVVYAKNLLHIARQFPVSLDTAMRTYAIRREIEDDVLYEDALIRNLDKNQNISKELDSRKNDLLYEKFFLSEITQKTDVSEKEIEDYFKSHEQEYGKSKLAETAPLIRNTIFNNKRQELFEQVALNLKSKAKIEINEKLLLTATKLKRNNRLGGKSK